jgi:hypothetical protein
VDDVPFERCSHYRHYVDSGGFVSAVYFRRVFPPRRSSRWEAWRTTVADEPLMTRSLIFLDYLALFLQFRVIGGMA